MAITIKQASELAFSIILQNKGIPKNKFNEIYVAFKESNIKKKSGHAGFGGGDSEYDYEDYIFGGYNYRFEFRNSGKRSINEL